MDTTKLDAAPTTAADGDVTDFTARTDVHVAFHSVRGQTPAELMILDPWNGHFRSDGSAFFRPASAAYPVDIRIQRPHTGLLPKHHRIDLDPVLQFRSRAFFGLNDKTGLLNSAALADGDLLHISDDTTFLVEVRRVAPFELRPLWRGRLLLERFGDRAVCANAKNGRLVVEECVGGKDTVVPHVLTRDAEHDLTVTELTTSGQKLGYLSVDPESRLGPGVAWRRAFAAHCARRVLDLVEEKAVAGFVLCPDGEVRGQTYPRDFPEEQRALTALGVLVGFRLGEDRTASSTGQPYVDAMVPGSRRAVELAGLPADLAARYDEIAHGGKSGFAALRSWIDAFLAENSFLSDQQFRSWAAKNVSPKRESYATQMRDCTDAEAAYRSAIRDAEIPDPKPIERTRVSVVSADAIIRSNTPHPPTRGSGEIAAPRPDWPDAQILVVGTGSASGKTPVTRCTAPSGDLVVRTGQAARIVQVHVMGAKRVIFPDVRTAAAISIVGNGVESVVVPQLEVVGRLERRDDEGTHTLFPMDAPQLRRRFDQPRPGLRYGCYSVSTRGKGSGGADWVERTASFCFACGPDDDVTALALAARDYSDRLFQNVVHEAIALSSAPPSGPFFLPEMLRSQAKQRQATREIAMIETTSFQRTDMSLETWCRALTPHMLRLTD